MNTVTKKGTQTVFRLSEFLSFLYQYSKPHYEDQPLWFRALFHSYHLDCDKLHDTSKYYMSKANISELLRNAYGKRFPPSMYRFYFQTKPARIICRNDFCQYLRNTILTEGSIQKLISELTTQVSFAKNIHPDDIAYIMRYADDTGDSFEKAASLCYRILLVSIS